MTVAVPRPALLLGLAGLIPFLYAAAAAQAPALEIALAPPLVIVEIYGPLIFAYMSGAFWGFAAGSNRAAGRAGWRWLGLAVAPAILLFLALIAAPGDVTAILTYAFPALLPVDYLFWRAKMAPRWWLALRVLLTAAVVACIWLAARGAGFAS